jgi:hypothetical protein
MCDEAQILLKDAKAKAEYIRLEIKRLETELLLPKNMNNSKENNSSNDQPLWPSEQSIEQLEHHLTIETTMKKGGENAVKVLKQTGAKKEVLAEAHQSLFESKQRIALLEEALRKRYKKRTENNSVRPTSSLYNDTLSKPAAVTGKLQVRLVEICLFLDYISFFLLVKDFLVVKIYLKMLCFQLLPNAIVSVQVQMLNIEHYVEKLNYRVNIYFIPPLSTR